MNLGMDLDARIFSLVRQGPGGSSLRDLCLLLFPRFSWAQMAPFAGFIRWRCHELVRAGQLCEITEDLFVARRDRPARRVYSA